MFFVISSACCILYFSSFDINSGVSMFEIILVFEEAKTLHNLSKILIMINSILNDFII